MTTQLRTAINLSFYPELFENGFNGGYGYPHNHVFTIPNITFSGHDLSIREILNKIAENNGNALWVVRLKPGEFAGCKPYWEGKPLNEHRHSPVNGRRRFIPLANVSRLAKEQVTVELTIEGLLDVGKETFPVLTEYGLSEGGGEGHGIASSDGSSCNYSVKVKEAVKDKVTVHVEVSARLPGRVESRVEEDVSVVRERISELEFNGGIKIRAYFEPHQAD